MWLKCWIPCGLLGLKRRSCIELWGVVYFGKTLVLAANNIGSQSPILIKPKTKSFSLCPILKVLHKKRSVAHVD